MLPHRAQRRRGPAAFALIDAIVITIVVGATAAIALPKLATAESGDGAARLRHDLYELRRAVTVYAAQHGDVPPGHPDGNLAATPTAATLAAQLTGWTDAAGRVSEHAHAAHRYGPYLRSIPVNAMSGLRSVRLAPPGRAVEAADEAGWVYQPNTLTVRADSSGHDRRGVSYSDY